MNENTFPAEILREQEDKVSILQRCLDSSVERIVFALLTFMIFVGLFVVVNIIICIIVIYIKS